MTNVHIQPPICTDRALELSWKDSNIRYLDHLGNSDIAFYLGWARQTASFASRSPSQFSWIVALCRRYEGHVDSLLSAEQTIVHGEFYPSNVLVKSEVVYPVDWESAAHAAGELDLAALIEGWSTQRAEPCILEYLSSRWP